MRLACVKIERCEYHKICVYVRHISYCHLTFTPDMTSFFVLHLFLLPKLLFSLCVLSPSRLCKVNTIFDTIFINYSRMLNNCEKKLLLLAGRGTSRRTRNCGKTAFFQQNIHETVSVPQRGFL